MYSHLSRREASVTKFLKSQVHKPAAPLNPASPSPGRQSPGRQSPVIGESEPVSRPAAGTLTVQLTRYRHTQ